MNPPEDKSPKGGPATQKREAGQLDMPPFSFQALHRSGSAKIARLTLGSKTISTPCYMTKLRRNYELNLICGGGLSIPHIQGVAYDIHSVKEVTKDREANLLQKSLAGEVGADPRYKDLKDSKLILIDPCTELFYLHPQNDDRRHFSDLAGLPKGVALHLANAHREAHGHFWKSVFVENEIGIGNFVTWFIKYQSKYGADLIIPPSTFIAENSKYFVDYAVQVNQRTVVLAKGFGKHSAVSFNINASVMSHSENEFKPIEREIISALLEDETLSEAKAVVIKIPGLQACFDRSHEFRRNLGLFLTTLGMIGRQTSRPIFLMDFDTIGYLALFNGLDGFIEPLNTYYGGRGRGYSRGSIYYRDTKAFYKFERYLEICEGNGGHLPSTTPTAQTHTIADLKAMNDSQWSDFRRKILLEERSIEVGEASDSIQKNYTRGISDRLSKAANQNYRQIVPNGF